MDKQNVIYGYDGIVFSHKKNEVLIQATVWMNLENTMLDERGRPKKCIYCMIPF